MPDDCCAGMRMAAADARAWTGTGAVAAEEPPKEASEDGSVVEANEERLGGAPNDDNEYLLVADAAVGAAIATEVFRFSLPRPTPSNS